ncbi:MAG: zinc ribbon domain-containing protein [Oscillospiraceae bacterium]|nr:zinc ribbon domain-containing protein [Oscillospiraceae bacterium]
MALIRCKECGRQVSDRANICPACGKSPLGNSTMEDDNTTVQPQGKKNKVAESISNIGNIIFAIFMIAGVIMVINGITSLAESGFGNEYRGYGNYTFEGIEGLTYLILGFGLAIGGVIEKIFIDGFAEIIQILHDIRKK